MASARNNNRIVGSGRPTARVALPFIVVASLGLFSAVLPPYEITGAEPVIVLSVFGVFLLAVVAGLRSSSGSWVAPVAPWLGFFVVAVAQDMTGGSSSGLAPLVALPIVWLAILGSRSDLMVGVVLTAAVFVVPMVLIGAPEYPAGDWRRAVLWTAFAGLVGPAIQRIVRQLAVETVKERRLSAEITGILRGARLSSIMTTDIDGTIRSFSVGSEELLGYSAEYMVDRRTPALLHDVDEVIAVAAELGVEPGFGVFTELARRGAPSRTWTYICADGRRVYVRLAVTELRDDDGVLTGYLGVAIDSSTAVEAEKALARSEAQWRLLMNHLPDVTVLVLDEDLTIRVISGAGAMRQGLEGSEGKNFSEVSNEANAAVWGPVVARAFEGHDGLVEMPSAITGALHEIFVTRVPTEEEDGRRVLFLARDISEERERENALVQAKERAERLFADAPHGVVLLTMSGIVMQVNDAMLAMTGREAADLEGEAFDLLARPGEDRLERHLLDAASDRGVPAEAEWTMRHTDGRDVHVLLSSRSLGALGAAFGVILVNVVDVSQRQRYEMELAFLADHDPLTGLANRRKFDEMLTAHLDRCDRYGPTGALLLLDLDNFKDVNDTLGHGAGDELIISVAKLLSSGMRRTDVVARLGGDEFAILLTGGGAEAAEAVAKSVVERLRAHTASLDGTRRRVTASVGVVTIAAAAMQAADILALADMTMYDAKDAGRDRYVMLDDGSNRLPRTGARLQWKGRIEAALENDDFSLRLQPILDLASNVVKSAEVLLRLDDTDSTVLPNEFLYIVERAGLAPAVDCWVLQRSIAMLAEIRRSVPDFQLEVNLSGHSIGDPGIERTIVDALREHEVDPAALVLEITETAAVADVAVARQFADRMTSLGCKFALDDFGAGFGSFYYLKHLVFDYVKIDGEFVANCHRSSIDRTIMRSIVGIARDLGKKTVAEFVAEPAILNVVREEGVDLAQGYFIGKPVRYDEFMANLLDEAAVTLS